MYSKCQESRLWKIKISILSKIHNSLFIRYDVKSSKDIIDFRATSSKVRILTMETKKKSLK